MISAETPVALVFPVDMLWSEDLIETFFAVKRSLQDADDLFEEGVIEADLQTACRIQHSVSKSRYVSVRKRVGSSWVFSMISTDLYVPLVRKHIT